ncbi:hypothetical protein [Curtobacterium sp. HSID17257]|uniref:hypothetical protein n=1 Tax=Curtobacterium sp. HSID17257 TaxID=2419510 RepID=UPI000F86F5EF|nr:hypothetical protein [Curtobacterium sp. HSID17257]RUQ08895.1 hypothetical protein D8M35_04135 [Curtobacterium sp. HSID17257]
MERTHKTLTTAVGAVVLAVIASAFAWYRLGPTTRATVWAEDGDVFFSEHLELGSVDSLLHPYAGYLHLLPRLVVDLAFHRPIEQYAVTVAGASCVVAGIVVAAVFVLSADVVRAWPLRLLLAAVPVILPIAPIEVLGNAANLHWLMLLLVPWVFTARVRTWWGSAAVAVLALFAVLTEPQALLFVPLLAVAWWRRLLRDALRAIPVTVVTLGGLGLQVWTALTTVRPTSAGDPSVAEVVKGYLLEPLAGAWIRDSFLVTRAVVAHGSYVVVVPVVAIAVLLVAALVVASWRARVQLVAFAIGSVGIWTAALKANSSGNRGWDEPAGLLQAMTTVPTRYAAPSAMLLTAAVVLAAALLIGPRPAQRARREPLVDRSRVLRVAAAVAGWGAVVVVVAAAVGSAAPGLSLRQDGPAWRPQVEAQVAACRADPSASIVVHNAPHAIDKVWDTAVPCRLVLGRR